jgi:hypothetical protein
MYKCYENINFRSATNTHPRRVAILVIIFCSVWFLSKKLIKLDFKKNKPKPVQTDLFRFGSVILEQKPVQISFFGLARFFSVWVRFFRFQTYKTETKPVNFLKIIISFFSQFGFFSYFFSSFLDLIDFYTK